MLLFIRCIHCFHTMILRKDNSYECCYKTDFLLVYLIFWTKSLSLVWNYTLWNVPEQYLIVHLSQLLEKHVLFVCYFTHTATFHEISTHSWAIISAGKRNSNQHSCLVRSEVWVGSRELVDLFEFTSCSMLAYFSLALKGISSAGL